MQEEEGGFKHGVDAGKNTIDSEHILIIYRLSRLL